MGPFPPIFCSHGLSSPAQPQLPWREKPGKPSLPSEIPKPSSQALRITGEDVASASVFKALGWAGDWSLIMALMSLEYHPRLKAFPGCQALYT